MTEAAIEWWRTAGQRSLARAALLEGVEHLKRALDQIATLPATLALRREEIKLEVAFANALGLTGDFVDSKKHYDRALAIYDPAEHGQLTTRSGRDIRVALLASRGSCLWLLGYPTASRDDAERAVKKARETRHATTLMYALPPRVTTTATVEITPLQMCRSASLSVWRTKEGHRTGKHLEPHCLAGFLQSQEGKPSDAVRAITSGITSLRSAGTTLYEPMHLQYLARAYAELGQLDDARQRVDDAIEKVESSKEKWCEAEEALLDELAS
jgi:tetratricopeptide (TPR) repeat protein